MEKPRLCVYKSLKAMYAQLIDDANDKVITGASTLNKEIKQQLISFYFAGIDTTGHLVAFALFALADYPEHRKRIIEEIKTQIKTLDDITYENLQVLSSSFRNWSFWDTFSISV